ncbi:MAG: hypothetical protein E4H36_03515 [Spirochaetales bacterium]|nr:MAG: hypothetical protein E4H36_03515 [Spirochaetales bacterium]
MKGIFNREQDERLKQFLYVTRVLDNLRAFRRQDPARLEQYMGLLGFGDLYRQLKSGIEAVVYLPNSLPGICRLIPAAGTLRSLFPVCLFGILISVLMRTGVLPVLNRTVYNVLLIVPAVLLVAFVIVDQVLRRKIAAYEKAHPDLHHAEKEELKKALDQVLHRFAAEISRKNRNPEDFTMKLYFNDYQRIRVISEKRERVAVLFKKKFSVYLAVPAGK